MSHVYLDPSRTAAERAADLLTRMTLPEKAQQLTAVLPNHIRGEVGLSEPRMTQLLGQGIGQIAGVSLGADSALEIAQINNRVQTFLRERTRLGIPALLHNEALNGVTAPEFTSFPTAIGLAATWDVDRVRQMADVVRDQLVSVGIRQALSPVLDIARDARWGRVHETFGEEVLLVSALGIAYVRGMQGDDASRGVIATAKHFLGYATTEGGQNTSATSVGPRELYDVFATPFEAAIRRAGLMSVMNSYSEVDGIPVAHSREVLTELLRDRLGFRGTVVSDYRSIQYAIDRHGAAPDPATSGALALHAGLDVELPVAFGYGATLVEAVGRGQVPIVDVDRSVLRVLTQKFELGLFDDPFVDETPAVVQASTRRGRDLARELAAESITLLHNDGTLPIARKRQKVAVIGPHASSVIGSFANYTYPPMLEMIKGIALGRSNQAGFEAARDELPPTLRDAFDRKVEEMTTRDPETMVREMYDAVGLTEALAAAAPELEVVTCAGSGVMGPIAGGVAEAVALAADADVVILAIGGRSGAFAGNATEGEGTDSASMDLPAAQLELLDAVAAAGKPVVAVITMGRPYALARIREQVSAIVSSFYPGPAASEAIAQVLVGERAPSGKLPFTVPRSVGQVPIYSAQKRGSGYRRLPRDIFKGYLDLPSTPLYPLGHGLSYVDFQYSDLSVDQPEVDTHGDASISFTVRNCGDMEATEVVQLYLGLPAVGLTRPAQQLAGFARVPLAAGEAARVTITVPMAMCGYSVTASEFVVDPGHVDVLVGASSDDIRVTGAFRITGDRRALGLDREYIPAVTVSPVVDVDRSAATVALTAP
jgi:beta-xylosidase